MSLERILYLVNATNGSTKSNEDFDINNSKCILGISQGLTSLLYDPKKQKIKNRHLYMKFIKDLCMQKGDHFAITEESCNIYLNSLEFSEDEFQFKKELAEPNEILNFFENQLNKHISKQGAIDFINRKDQEAFGQDFEFTPLRTIEYHTDNKELLSSLISKQDIPIEK
ncbi:PREDICTED: uncharacterized protein LOC108557401 [Nicrophorus vespilloides]|uniref:Uncharacterized protein LOC108557401 n=1 Tax=Nicrophorus vespilloides TaxID=110193 RepID=A0ABM1M484_NICVS|nr:PREDICTED: uncharacterized protein LOC108557401 [Nicrophorus vespilloides]